MNTSKIIPFCKYKPGVFIEFTGAVTPCCWLTGRKEAYESLAAFLGEDMKYTTVDNTKEDIVRIYKKIEDTWSTDEPFSVCNAFCNKDKYRHPLKHEDLPLYNKVRAEYE